MKKSLVLVLLLIAGMLFAWGCSDDADAGHGHGEEITAFEIIDRSKDEVVAYVHVDHWHGSLPVVHEGEHLSLGAYIEEDGEEEYLDGDHHALGVALAPGAEEGIVTLDLHGDHVHIKGVEEGETMVVFQFIHDGEVEYETPPIKVVVVHDDGHDHDHAHDEEITAFEIINRRADEVAAYVHGDHWHGSLPEVVLGENISLGAYIEEDGEEEYLDGDHHALGVALAPGAEEGIVSFDLHGDHVHIKGESEGETMVVFQFIHDGEVEYETPPIAVKVIPGS